MFRCCLLFVVSGCLCLLAVDVVRGFGVWCLLSVVYGMQCDVYCLRSVVCCWLLFVCLLFVACACSL